MPAIPPKNEPAAINAGFHMRAKEVAICCLIVGVSKNSDELDQF
jgi:hypothetical protein